jgi:hypothetical protein
MLVLLVVVVMVVAVVVLYLTVQLMGLIQPQQLIIMETLV